MDISRAREVLACGLAGGDISNHGLVRFAGVSPTEAHAALCVCRDSGLIDNVGGVDQTTAIALLDELPPDLLLSIRARAARAWMTIGPSHFLAEVEQARGLGSLIPNEEIVELSDNAGRMSLSLHDYATAAALLRLAMDFDVSSEAPMMTWRLCDLASALDGLGNVVEARELLARAAILGEIVKDGALVAAAAVQYALPADWYAGDTRASALLDRAASFDLSEADAVKVLAARSLVEMRIPIAPTSDQQIAWVSRPQVAHALANEALDRSSLLSADVRALTTLAWRTTHRSPSDLNKRREISREALNLSQVLRLPSHQVESAIWLAVDAVESADRPLYDEALSVTRWVAEKDGNPRLIWRAHTLCAGAAHMEGNLDEAENWRLLARAIGESVSAPGWLAADLLLKAEFVVSLGDRSVMSEHLLPEDSPALLNPIGRAVAAQIHAHVGDQAVALRMVRKSLRQLDFESSYLLLTTRCANVALCLEDQSLAKNIIPILEPWQGHVAVDSNGWWIDGPVDYWLAALWQLTEEDDRAKASLENAENIARVMDDTRSLGRISDLRLSLFGSTNSSHGISSPRTDILELSERQRVILELMSHGLTNREIASRLSFSVSTIRVETIAIYRVLGVKGRSEAVAKLTQI